MNAYLESFFVRFEAVNVKLRVRQVFCLVIFAHDMLDGGNILPQFQRFACHLHQKVSDAGLVVLSLLSDLH